ncbi:hypothetical protein [Pseudorhodoferax sp.]|uniref:hypothetical protein n=1 Tax=Pseudorhodoferax sp. TaxID=1993553 RepID=UPI0039E32B78
MFDAVGRFAGQEQTALQAEQRRQQVEAEQVRKAADRAKALGTMYKAQADLDTLGDDIAEGIASGDIDKRAAEREFSTRAQERVTQAMADVPMEHAELTRIDLESRVGRLGRGVRRAVTQRDQQDVRAGIGETLEAAQRLYLAEPAKADALVLATLEQQGPHSGMAPDQLHKLRQGYLEGTRLNKAQALVSAARRDNRALGQVEQALQGEEFAQLDPARRTALYAQIEGFRVSNDQRAEAAARRAEAAQERHLRQAQAEFEAASALVSSGKILSDDYIAGVTQATAGTPYAKALPELVRQAPERTAFSMQPLAAQDEVLRQARTRLNQHGTDPATEKRIAAMEKARDDARRDLLADPYQAAADRGVIDGVQPLRMDLQSLPAQLMQRREAADAVRQWAGRDVSLFRPDEAQQIGDTLRKLPAQEKAPALDALAAVMSPGQRRAFAAQMEGGKDRSLALAMRFSGRMTTPATSMFGTPIGSPRLVSELILKGAQARADGTSTKGEQQPDVKANSWRSYAARELMDVFPNQQDANDLAESAELIMHGMAAEGGGRLAGNDMGRAIRMALGGSLVEHNGRKIPLPAGVNEQQLTERLRSAGPVLEQQARDGTVRVAGVSMPVAEFAKTLPGQQLMPIRQGVYAVLVGGRPVTNSAGKVIEVGAR